MYTFWVGDVGRLVGCFEDKEIDGYEDGGSEQNDLEGCEGLGCVFEQNLYHCHEDVPAYYVQIRDVGM